MNCSHGRVRVHANGDCADCKMEYYVRNRKHILATHAQYRANLVRSPEAAARRSAYMVKYRADNKQRLAEKVTQYRQNPAVKARRAENQRRYNARPETKAQKAETARLFSHGVTPEWYATRFAKGCQICLRSFGEGERRAEVDHDHECCAGKKSCRKCLRGLICRACNRDALVGLDYLIRIGALERAIAYAKSRGRFMEVANG